MSYYEKNLKALEQQQPYLKSKLEKKEFHTGDTKIYEEKAKDGNPVLIIEREDGVYRMNSRFRPVSEAVTYAEQFSDIKDYSVYLFLGFGNGLIPREIIKHGSELVRYAFYEPCMESFLYVMEHYDISDILGDIRATIYVEGINEKEVAAYLPDMIDWSNIPLTDIFVLPKYKDMYPVSYRNFVCCTRDVVARAQMGMNTIVKYADRELLNAVYNMIGLPGSISAENFVHVFPKDLPAVLVSAGPSLNKNVDLLKEYKNKVFILCMDKTVKVLYDHGIIPDAIISVDPVKGVYYTEEMKEFYKEAIWITTTTSNFYTHIPIPHRRRVLLEGGDLLNGSIYKEFTGAELPTVSTGGSVATSAFSVIEGWGFETLIFIGQDLSFPGNKRYSDSTTDVIQESIEKGFSIIETPGYYGDTVKTRDDYYTYLKWFEGAISITKIKNVINSTEGGAMIAGATNMPLKEALETYATQEYDIASIIDQVSYSFTNEQETEIQNIIENYPKRMDYFIRLFKEGRSLCERGKTLVERGNYSEKELKKIRKRLDEIDKGVSNEKEFIILSNRACEVERKITREMLLDTEEDKEDDKKTFETLITLYGGFYEAAVSMKEKFEEIIKYGNENGWRW